MRDSKNAETIEEIKPGMILECSWGYDQTQYEYCKVLENTGKTLKCRMVKQKRRPSTGFVGEYSLPTEEILDDYPPFRLRISKSNEGRIWIRGSYPYVPNDKRFDYWYPWDGTEDYNTER